ncbi:RHS repeat-associated core domain-containing protein [Photorhabdus heterorhabditis]|uniref:RHS repeat-associated core domain-containing protein n=1 Tax=Photorhabdus heterorhabditis TaxID=880156 RepID=UPI0030DA08DF
MFDGWELVAQQTQPFTLNLDNRVELMAGEVQTQYAVSAPTGEPLALFDPAGKRVWRQPKQSLYGLRLSGLGENPQLDPGLRFAGQLFDEESGLFYNRFRYYLPEGGCYLSADPLGLAGGLNPYSYVHNPTGWVDPLGLAGCPAVKDSFEQARNKALNWLTDREFKAEKVNTGKFGSTKNQPVGMTTADGKTGFRIEYDERSGAHINVFSGKEKGEHFLFDATEKTVTKLQKLFDLPSKPWRGS